MSDSKPLIDPKELIPMVKGLCLGVCLIAFFFLLAKGLGLTTIVDHGNIPYQ